MITDNCPKRISSSGNLQSQPMQNIQLESSINIAAYPFDFYGTYLANAEACESAA